MSDARTPTYDQLSALCAQMAAALERAKEQMARAIGLQAASCTGGPFKPINDALTAYRTLSPDPVYAEAKNMFEALQNTHDDLNGGFVACATCGSQEDTTDLDCMSLYIIPALSRARGEG